MFLFPHDDVFISHFLNSKGGPLTARMFSGTSRQLDVTGTMRELAQAFVDARKFLFMDIECLDISAHVPLSTCTKSYLTCTSKALQPPLFSPCDKSHHTRSQHTRNKSCMLVRHTTQTPPVPRRCTCIACSELRMRRSGAPTRVVDRSCVRSRARLSPSKLPARHRVQTRLLC